LTGITSAMLVGAPRIDSVLPAFLEFAGLGPDTVLVAHNARFDVGFLRAAARHLGLPWPQARVVDTLRLARAIITRDEVRNYKLATLARFVGATTSPDHRALHDARATVDLLHALLGRLGPLGVTHLEDLITVGDPVPHARRKKSAMAADLPTCPGVYQFVGPDGHVLYVGKAMNLRKRVRSYFTAAEGRRRIGEMLDLARSVRHIPCATDLEATVRELRLISELRPPYNVRSRNAARTHWLRLTDEHFPRLSVVRDLPVDEATAALGPFASRTHAQLALEALHDSFPIRQCTTRLPLTPRPGAHACMLADMARCGAPCTGRQTKSDYAALRDEVAHAMQVDPGPVVDALVTRMSLLSEQSRYEEASTVRERMRSFLSGAQRYQRLGPIWRSRELVAARRLPAGGWEIVVARYGRLAASTTSPPGADPMPAIAAARSTAAEVGPPTIAMERASAAETQLIAEWMEQPGTRLVHVDTATPLARPVRGAERFAPPPRPLPRHEIMAGTSHT
ncbi:MAG TPA: DEDD exonuclease domain-containing protein, partial [Actinomycetaceae bacterium]|nr:DEDD exonuclease domain-containing protein [Actinomycetaceae bacterium]